MSEGIAGMLAAAAIVATPLAHGASLHDAFAAHFEWQRRALATKPESVRFLVVNPGSDQYSHCRNVSSSGLACARGYIWSGEGPPANLQPAPNETWSAMLRRRGLIPRLSGLGNIMLPLAASAIVAVLSGRVMLVRRWQSSDQLARPLADLFVDEPGNAWAPHLRAAEGVPSAIRETFLSHDDLSGGAHLCDVDVREQPAERVWLIHSNQYFLPLLMYSRHHAEQLRAWAAPPAAGLWAEAARFLLRPTEALTAAITEATRARAVAIGARMPCVAIQMRCGTRKGARCSPATQRRAAECAVRVLQERENRTDDGCAGIYVASQHEAARSYMRQYISNRTPAAVWTREERGAPAALAPGHAHEDGTRDILSGDGANKYARFVDLWLLANSATLLTSRGSTYGYVAAALHDGAQYKFDTCQPLRSREASFHMLIIAVRHGRTCRAAHAAMLASARARNRTAVGAAALSLFARVRSGSLDKAVKLFADDRPPLVRGSSARRGRPDFRMLDHAVSHHHYSLSLT